MQVRFLGQDPLKKEMGICSSILAWKIPWTEEPGELQSKGSQRVKNDLVTECSYMRACVYTCTHAHTETSVYRV